MSFRKRQNKLKTALCVILTIIMVFSITGCSDIEDVEEQTTSIQVINGDYASAIDSAEVGDTFIFGTYEQDNDKTNGREPIEWRVLDKNEKGVLLLSEYILTFEAYEYDGGNITWEKCSIWSSWNEFDIYKFDEEDAKHIKWSNIINSDNPVYGTDGGSDTIDRFFILSYDEVNKYLPDEESRRAIPTTYAIEKYRWNDVDYTWWLRTPGKTQSDAMVVDENGVIETDGRYVDSNKYNGVRPAIWLVKEEQIDIYGPATLTYANIDNAEIGNIVHFGKYEQNGDVSETEPIEWVVLAKNEDKLLLISRYIIEKMRFGTSPYWKKSEIRQWLNNDFYLNSFSDDERVKMQRVITSDETDDLIFLLSAEEARLLFKTNAMRIARITEYLKNKGYKDYHNNGNWWTRSVSTATNGKGVVPVETEGNVRSAGTNYLAPEKYVYTDTGVRPVICIDLAETTDEAVNMEIFGHNSADDLDNEPMPSGGSSNTGSSNSGGKCLICNGSGYVKYYYGSSDLEAILDGHDSYTVDKCPTCNGTGKD